MLLVLVSFSWLQADGHNKYQKQAEADRLALLNYFQQKFSDVDPKTFNMGVYALSEDYRSQYEEINEFPPYEFQLEDGQEMFEKEFANGNSFETCLADGSLLPAHKYPFFDEARQEVITLSMSINACLQANGEKRIKYGKSIAGLAGYMAFRSRGEKVNVEINSQAALDAFNKGKEFYFTKRGYLNNSCATCHVQGAGQRVRTETLHQGIADAAHWPVHRLKSQRMLTLHERFAGCHRDQGTQKLALQSETYRNLEFFVSYLSNDYDVTGPNIRK